MADFTRRIVPVVVALFLGAAPAAHAGVTGDIANFLGLGDSKAPVEKSSTAASADAGIGHRITSFLGLSKTEPGGPQQAAAEDIPAPTANAPVTVKAPDTIAQAVDLKAFAMPGLASLFASLPEPSVEKPLHKLFCVEYARELSGLNIFGDAKYWWERARNLYARVRTPVEHAVMVFTPTARLKKGHVAVVSAIVSKREIRVEQANWQNHGEIDHATPIVDVSPNNDWSRVRVWDIGSKSFGRVYPVSGFIAKDMVRQASRD